MDINIGRRIFLKTSAIIAAQTLFPRSYLSRAAAELPGRPEIFDSYAHVISPDQVRYPPNPLGGESLRENTFNAPLTPEDLIAVMDKSGIDWASVIHRAFVYGYDCRLIFEAASAHPERLSAVPVVNPNDSNVIANIEKWKKEYRIPAIRIMGERHNEEIEWIDQPAALKLWDAATEMQLPVEIELYPGNNIAGLERLFSLLAKRPKARAVVDNLAEVPAIDPDGGFPETWIAASEVGNLSFKVATRILKQNTAEGKDPALFMRKAVDLFGADRLMWGSNINHTTDDYEAMVALAIRASGLLTETERNKFLRANGINLFWPG